ENIANIRLICDESLRSGVSPFRIILPPSDLCCDLTLSTRVQYYKGNNNAWHANTDYWVRIVEQLMEQDILDL
ncbi:hypothetical protein, partial [Aphanothece microscopica]